MENKHPNHQVSHQPTPYSGLLKFHGNARETGQLLELCSAPIGLRSLQRDPTTELREVHHTVLGVWMGLGRWGGKA